MFTSGLKRHFIGVSSALFAALCLLSTASHGQDEWNPPPPVPSTIQNGNLPSVEQALVPEGVFAMQLAEALKLGPVQDEASAEKLLSDLGIEPKNGWITDYPVTPAVLGDFEKGISLVSDQGKIALTKDQALKLFGELKARLGFDVNPGTNAPANPIKKPGNTKVYIYTDTNGVTHFTDEYDSIPKEYRKNAKVISRLMLDEHSGGSGDGTKEALQPQPQPMTNPPPEIINHYYEQSPPVVTYYSPPDTYSYLYSWIPYPFWSTGFYFPGFFVLNNFHRHVFFNQHPYFVTHHADNGAFPHPLNTGLVNRDRHGHLTPERTYHSPWFSTPKAQAGARAIVILDQNRDRSINRKSVSRLDTSRRPFSSFGNPGTFGNAPVVPNGRVLMKNDLFRLTPYSGGGIGNKPGLKQPFSSSGNSGTFGNAPVVPDGRVMMKNDLFRPTPYSGGGIGNKPGLKQPFSSSGNSGTFGNAPVVPNGRVLMKNDLFRPMPYSGGGIRNQSGFNQRTYTPNMPRFYSPPAFGRNRDLRSSRSFGRNVPGGFNRGRSFEGVQVNKSFPSRGGSPAGAQRGGHR